MKKISYSIILSALVVLSQIADAQVAVMTVDEPRPLELRFNGTASGGWLYLVMAPGGPETPALLVRTEPGETPEQISAKFMTAQSETWLTPAIAQIQPSGAGGIVMYSPFFLSGTEIGLGIPPPPTSLTYAYRSAESQVDLHWENPLGSYDKIILTTSQGVHELDANANSFTLTSVSRVGWMNPLKSSYGIIGYKNGTPSSAASIQADDCSFDESIGYAFYNNVMPNWKKWSKSASEPLLSEARRVALDDPDLETSPDAKTRFQKIEGAPTPFSGGTARRFVGLQPGSYRVSIRVNTLESPPTGDWTASIHLATHPRGTMLSSEQLAGTAPLPSGQLGPSAGQWAIYYSQDHGGAAEPSAKTTGGTWALRTTDQSASDNLAGGLSLPEGHDAVTIWSKLEGQAPTAQLGIDWIKLERLDCAP